ncbi:hypothetical protein C0J52_18327 [Blattella germanica]|nr:hypothetical protein C0J52_18327 [Blattella germanica]
MSDDEELSGKLTFSDDGAPPHWHLAVWNFLNEQFAGRCIGWARYQDNVFCSWPSRSPDLTVLDLFFGAT